MSYRIEPLDKHDRRLFTCGSPGLDRYFREQATQDTKRRVAFFFVAVSDAEEVAGFCTLAATSLAVDMLPPERARKLPRYPVIPAVLLGRLGVAIAHQGKQLGTTLVIDALKRAARSDIAGHAMVVDAKDQRAADFYESLGFERLTEASLRLIRRL